MPARELLQPANLVSLLRIVLTAPMAYYLSLDDSTSAFICLGLILIAAITDGLDGYLARRLNQVTPLGIALDPVADKLFAGILVVLLVIYRDFPLWLAVIVLGRDLLIMGLGLILMRGRSISLPSNLTGKYAFASLAVLLASYVVRFDLAISIMVWPTLFLLGASMIAYGRVLFALRRGQPPPVFHDRPLFQRIRTIGSTLFSLAYLLMFARFVGLW